MPPTFAPSLENAAFNIAVLRWLVRRERVRAVKNRPQCARIRPVPALAQAPAPRLSRSRSVSHIGPGYKGRNRR